VLRLAQPYFWVADYYPTEEVLESDGLLRVSLRVADPAWVRALVLGSSGQVEVLSPGWLAESIRSEAVAALAGYAAK
jgi:proteasome accessory factor C